ncbi:MAG TPA: L,D-transpeptidase, partial [Micromonosporaceae bacterium]|nr:L,D-transpeptidase [Micromonosporaceae bacterium]
AWFGDRQVFYRGPAYWLPGTRIAVRAALEGAPMGGGRYGDMDRAADVRVAKDRVELTVDNTTKMMSVFQGSRLLKTMPVSLGKPGTPSSSGTMVIMDKAEHMVFDTRNDPDPSNRYVAPVSYAQRLTWGGEFIHAAPWSEEDQGYRNVSHGCVNISWSNAEWLFAITHIGDPIVVRATEQRLEPGNGWTAWDVPWDQFLKRSALPHPDLIAAAASLRTAEEPIVKRGEK